MNFFWNNRGFWALDQSIRNNVRGENYSPKSKIKSQVWRFQPTIDIDALVLVAVETTFNFTIIVNESYFGVHAVFDTNIS